MYAARLGYRLLHVLVLGKINYLNDNKLLVIKLEYRPCWFGVSIREELFWSGITGSALVRHLWIIMF